MVYIVLSVFACVILIAAAAIYWLGWIGAALVAAGILSLPWTGRVLGKLLMEYWARGVLNDIAKPLENAQVTLESLEGAATPSVEEVDYDDDDPEAFADFEAANRDRDWHWLEVTITPDKNLNDNDGLPRQWDPELILPFVPSGDGQDDLEDALVKVCEVVRWEIFHEGKWLDDGLVGCGPTRMRFHVGLPGSANRIRFLF